MRRFFAELRRRDVPRIAAAYALSAWILIEAGSVLLPTFGATDGLFRIYVILVIAGFAVAVTLAWVFQWTPEGVKLDRNVTLNVSALPAARGQRLNYAIIVLLIAALTVSITFNIVGIGSGAGGGAAAPPRSIAVLPFESLGGHRDSAMFADGIHDDLLTRLASIRSLKVISRSSVMEYRDTTKNVREIGEELGVESVLDGSVQRVGDKVRINLQLIDADTDEHLWAHSYYRVLTLEDIFSIQREISEAVAEALRTTLSPEEQAKVEAAAPTTDLRAYRLYKEGRQNLYLRRLETLRKARTQFEEALTLDPRYAQAHAGLAESLFLLWNNHSDLPQDEAIPLIEASLDRALELDPRLADAYAIRGVMKSTLWQQDRTGRQNVEAEAAFRRTLEINRNHASAYMWFAALRDNEERLPEAIELYQHAMELDPLARIPYVNLPLIYAKKGEHHAAMQLWLEGARVHNDWPTVHQYIATHLWGMGRLDEAYAWYAKARDQSGDPLEGGGIGIGIIVDLDDLGRAEALLDTILREHPLARAADGFRALLEEDFRGASQIFASFAEERVMPARGLYVAASDAALLAGDLDKAREYALAADPLLASDAGSTVDRQTLRNAVKLAYIHLRQGRERQGIELLNQSLDLIGRLPRLGTYGFGIRDVQIHALLGRKQDALNAFREALDDGYRGSVLFDGWPLALDPYLESLRGEPRFIAMVDELESYVAAMRERLAAAERNGDLTALRARAETI